jgi:predicted nicotinamide N-methyase
MRPLRYARCQGMDSDLVTQTIDLPKGPLRVQQPREAAETPDVGGVEWAPVAPYWSVIWRSGVALAGEVDGLSLEGQRVVELGCGLAIPSMAAARAGATALATDGCTEALDLVAHNSRLNDLGVKTARVDWDNPKSLVVRSPFDLVLAADILYKRWMLASLLALMPRLAPVALIADPGRSPADAFFEEARKKWSVKTKIRDVVTIHRVEFA